MREREPLAWCIFILHEKNSVGAARLQRDPMVTGIPPHRVETMRTDAKLRLRAGDLAVLRE